MSTIADIELRALANRTKDVSLILRINRTDNTSHNGFRWPESGPVECPDWKPTQKCGNGLHGFLFGQGDGSCIDSDRWVMGAKWLVVEVMTADIIDLGGKVKYPRGIVSFCGEKSAAIEFLTSHPTYPAGGVKDRIVGSTLTGGDGSTLTGGNHSTLTGGVGSTLTGGVGSTLTGGDGSTLTGGNHSTLTGGDGSTLTGGNGSTLTGGVGSTLTGGNHSTLTGGNHSTLTGGNHSTLTGGDYSTLTGGDYSTLTGGDYSTLTSGNGSTLTGGNHSTLTGGNGSTLTGGNGSTLTGGDHSTLVIKWYDYGAGRYRLIAGYPGEDGMKVNTKYRLNATTRKFEEVVS